MVRRGPRKPNLEAELPPASLIRIASLGVRVEDIQAWLDDPDCKFDGASGVIDIFLPAEAVHDYLYRNPIPNVSRWAADAAFRDIMLDLTFDCEEAWFGRLQGVGISLRRWAGVRVLGIIFYHKPVTGTRAWVSPKPQDTD